MAVVAMGKLGSREMTAASDLDLILIYDFPADAGESDGARPLGAGVYYSRLTQRLLAALTAPTRAGRLYEVDMRLRPSGRKGPLATQFSAFALYQRDEAETWEHMALTRARVVAGDPSLAAEVGEGGARHSPARARPGKSRPRGAQDARADRSREGRRGPLGPEARQGRPDGHRVRRAVPQPRLRPCAARHPRRLDPQG